MKGKHAKKKKSYIRMIISLVLCLTLVVFLFYHFQDEDEEDYLQYALLEGQIAAVGDETLLVRLDDNREYLVSIAGVIDSNKGLLVGNKISIRYDGQLDDEYDDIQNIKVKQYQIDSTIIANSKKATIDSELSQLVQNMTLEEKIAQMFLIRCPEEGQSEFVSAFQPGGYLLFADDFEDKSQEDVIQSIRDYQNESKINMFIAVDEEGGSVVRVSSNKNLASEKFKSPREIYASGGFDAIKEDTINKSKLLKSLGINLNLAPVVDVSTNPSDYMYATDLSLCIQTGSNYSVSDCEVNDWLFIDEPQWTISSTIRYPHLGFNIYYNFITDGRVYYTMSVRPVVYLKSNIVITDGFGTSSDPYILR